MSGKKFWNKALAFAVLSAMILSMLAACGGTAPTPAPLQATTMDEAAKGRVAVLLGSVHDTYMMKNYPAAQVMQYKNYPDMLLALREGKVDSGFISCETTREMQKTDKSLVILVDNLFTIPMGMGFNKENDALREQFNAFLKEIKSNGVYDDLVKRWFKDGSDVMPVIENTGANGQIVVGNVSDKGMPFTVIKNNQLIGSDIEFVLRFGAYLQKKVVFSDMDFGSLIAAVSANKVDMIASTVLITEERKKQIDFSDPYYELQSCVVGVNNNTVSAAEASQMTTMDEVAKGKIGVLLGTVYDTYLQKNYPTAEVLQYKNYPDLILAVQSKKVDSGFINCQAFKELQKENPFLTLFVSDVFTNPVGVGFNKENSALREEFNAFLAEIKANGVYDDWYQRWIKDGNYEMPVIENSKINGKIVVGIVSDKGYPFSVLENNKLVGSDIELMERFGAYLQKEVEFSDMEFGALIAAVSTNKVETITSTIMITDERKKQIDFSDPYFELSACVMGAKKEAETVQEKSPSFFQGVSDSFYNNIIAEDRYLLIVDGIKTTGVISIFAILFGTLLGALICFMRMSRQWLAQGFAKVYISIVRGIPVLVLLMLIFYVVFARVDINPVVAAVLAFGINFAAYVSEMFRASIESIDKGQTEAGIAGGFTKAQTFIYIVMPQAIRRVLPVYKGELITLVKLTSIVGYIAVQDLTKASDIIRSRTFDAFFPLIMTAVLYFLISWLLLWLLDTAEQKTALKRKGSRSISG
jgi:polar amino acid transport system substrate-binding protein